MAAEITEETTGAPGPGVAPPEPPIIAAVLFFCKPTSRREAESRRRGAPASPGQPPAAGTGSPAVFLSAITQPAALPPPLVPPTAPAPYKVITSVYCGRRHKSLYYGPGAGAGAGGSAAAASTDRNLQTAAALLHTADRAASEHHETPGRLGCGRSCSPPVRRCRLLARRRLRSRAPRQPAFGSAAGGSRPSDGDAAARAPPHLRPTTGLSSEAPRPATAEQGQRRAANACWRAITAPAPAPAAPGLFQQAGGAGLEAPAAVNGLGRGLQAPLEGSRRSEQVCGPRSLAGCLADTAESRL
ncbi:skin secretory protein xP2-like [Schistocerca cancellata]|uniref:skin secretory protein xP2-like n=1 Tax=Schistocerca cancellata TaxID=274614 RepID=UPI002117F6F3|nr:skin secretory protein xP2-like [Schistocerca cancellata]